MAVTVGWVIDLAWIILVCSLFQISDIAKADLGNVFRLNESQNSNGSNNDWEWYCGCVWCRGGGRERMGVLWLSALLRHLWPVCRWRELHSYRCRKLEWSSRCSTFPASSLASFHRCSRPCLTTSRQVDKFFSDIIITLITESSLFWRTWKMEMSSENLIAWGNSHRIVRGKCVLLNFCLG